MFVRIAKVTLFAMCVSLFLTRSINATAPQTASVQMRIAIDAYLKQNKLQRGWDPAQSRLVVVETSSVGVAPGDLLYFTKRQEAFQNALVAARKTTAQFLGAEIKSSITAKKDLTQVVGDPELAKALTGEAVHVAFKLETELEKMSEVAAQAALV